jgi:hypothetical protein
MTSKWPLTGLFSEHERVRRDLSAYIDEQLEADERARVERHLASCAECRAELESLRRTVQLLRSVPPVAPPRSFLLPATAAPTARPARYSPLFFGLRNATAALAAMLVAVAAVNVVFNPPTAIAPTEGREAAPQSAPAPRPTAVADLRDSSRLAAAAKPTEVPPAPAEAQPAAAAKPAQPSLASAPAAKPAEPPKPAEAAKPAAAARSAEAPAAAATKPAAAAESANAPKSSAPAAAAGAPPLTRPPQVAAAPASGQAAPPAAPGAAASPSLTDAYASTPSAGAPPAATEAADVRVRRDAPPAPPVATAIGAAASPVAAPDQAARMVPAAPSTPERSPLDVVTFVLGGLAVLSAAATATVWYRDRRRT